MAETNGGQAHAGAQQQLAMLTEDEKAKATPDRMSTFLQVETKPDLPPNMRMSTRWNYLEEYFGYWLYHKYTVVGAVALLVAGIATLGIFWPGALLMIGVAGRLADLAWWNNFIINTFGKSRTLVLVD